MTAPTPFSNAVDAGAPDVELIARFRAGDGRALETLLQRYEVPLFQFLLPGLEVVVRRRNQRENGILDRQGTQLRRRRLSGSLLR